MKGLINKTVAALGFSGALAVGGGCDAYRNLVDPCYPQRYEFASRQETAAAMLKTLDRILDDDPNHWAAPCRGSGTGRVT